MKHSRRFTCLCEAQSAEAISEGMRLLRFPFAMLRASAHRNDSWRRGNDREGESAMIGEVL